MRARSSTLAPGQLVGRYRIESPLGEGGMGEVYRAHDTMLLRSVALKIVRTGATGAGGTAGAPDDGQRARFLREARAVAGLHHPNVVTIFDVGEVDGTPYLAMELLDGRPLKAFVGESIAFELRVRWLADIANALGAAHRAGLVHRDVKPDNVMVCKDGIVKILDFGVAKAAAVEGPPSGLPHGGAGSFRTGFGFVAGTPRYMAPEQAAGLTVDPRTDQFAWGLVAFELLTGRHPRDVGPGFSKDAEWRDPAPPIERLCPGLPPPVAQSVNRALDRFPDARFPSMDAILAAIAPFAGTSAPSGGVRPMPATMHPPLQPMPMAPSGVSTLTGPPTLGSRQTPPPSVSGPTPKKSGSPWLAIGLGALALVAIGSGGAALAYWKWYASDTTTSTTSSPDAATPSPKATASTPSPPPSASASRSASPLPPAPPARADAGSPRVVTTDAGKAHVPIVLVCASVVPNADYSAGLVQGAVQPRLAKVEACLNATGADRATIHTADINIPYTPDGAVLASSVQTFDPAMTKCLTIGIADHVALGPPKSGRGGALVVQVWAR